MAFWLCYFLLVGIVLSVYSRSDVYEGDPGFRVVNASEELGRIEGALRGVPGVEEAPRFRMGSPRLARPELAADFAKDVTEVVENDGL